MGNGQLIVPGTAGLGDVLTGKTFSAGPNYGTAGTMPNNGSKTVILSSSQQNLAAGYYSSITVPAGARYASGTVTSSSATIGFTLASNTIVNLVSVTVTGLTFTPSRIIIASQTLYLTVYDASDPFSTSPIAPIAAGTISGSGASTQAFGIQLTSPASVTSTGFVLPSLTGFSYPCNWYAYQ
jgi:hypothetical protein